MPDCILIAVGPGELADRLSILRIKARRIADPAKLARVRAELAEAEAAGAGLAWPADLAGTLAGLEAVNGRIWQAEARIRGLEAAGEFGPAFVALARAVRADNDRRAELKRAINERMGSALAEVKEYRADLAEPPGRHAPHGSECPR